MNLCDWATGEGSFILLEKERHEHDLNSKWWYQTNNSEGIKGNKRQVYIVK